MIFQLSTFFSSGSTEQDEILFRFHINRNLDEIQHGEIKQVDFEIVQSDSVIVYVANALDDLKEDTIRNNNFQNWKRTSANLAWIYPQLERQLLTTNKFSTGDLSSSNNK